MKDIITARLIIRELNTNDANAIFAIWNAKENRATIGGHEDTYEEVVELCNNKTRTIESGVVRAVTLKETGEIIGTCRFGNYGKPYWNFGYNIKSTHWNNGYATEVLSAIIKFGKEEYSVKRFRGGALKENIASQRVMEKCGLKFCGLDSDGDPDYELLIKENVIEK